MNSKRINFCMPKISARNMPALSIAFQLAGLFQPRRFGFEKRIDVVVYREVIPSFQVAHLVDSMCGEECQSPDLKRLIRIMTYSDQVFLYILTSSREYLKTEIFGLSFTESESESYPMSDS